MDHLNIFKAYIIKGRIAHKDSMGNSKEIREGEIQVMSAGTGVTHSEYNPDVENTLELLQIWIEPSKNGVAPRYGQEFVSPETSKNKLKKIVSPEGKNGTLMINQDAEIFALLLEKGNSLNHLIRPGRHSWIQVVKGQLLIQGQAVEAGDGVAISEETALHIEALNVSEILLFDLP